DLSSNFLSGPLDPFISPLTGLTALKYLVMSYNFFSGSIPSTISAIKSLYMLSLGWNYLTGTVPVPGTALQVLDLENNWLNGKFPSTANWYFCTARANCFNDPTPCKNNNNQGITQRPSCAICNSADATGTLCGGTVACQPDPAAVKAVTAVPTTSTPVLALTCPPVPPVTTDATAASALMNIKTALGVTYTNWAASSTCNAVGSSGGGGFSGVECNSAGQPVKITLDSQKLSGILHADITKLTALTFISLKSNLFKARLEEFGSKIPLLPNLAVLLLDFNWFFGSLSPALIGMPKLTRLGLSYNYLTYRVPPLAAGLKDIDVGFNFLSGSFPANTATSCGANNNCFQAVTGCTTKGTAQRTTGCSFCLSDTAQGMLCYGRGICTVDASAPFAAGTPNAVGAATLPLACVNVLCATASPVMLPCSRGMELPASEVDPKTAMEHGRRLVEVMLRPVLAYAKAKHVHCSAALERNDSRDQGLCAAARRANADRVYIAARKKLLSWSSSSSAYQSLLPPSCTLVVAHGSKKMHSLPGTGGMQATFPVPPNAFIACRFNASAASSLHSPDSGAATPDSSHHNGALPGSHLASSCSSPAAHRTMPTSLSAASDTSAPASSPPPSLHSSGQFSVPGAAPECTPPDPSTLPAPGSPLGDGAARVAHSAAAGSDSCSPSSGTPGASTPLHAQGLAAAGREEGAAEGAWESPVRGSLASMSLGASPLGASPLGASPLAAMSASSHPEGRAARQSLDADQQSAERFRRCSSDVGMTRPSGLPPIRSSAAGAQGPREHTRAASSNALTLDAAAAAAAASRLSPALNGSTGRRGSMEPLVALQEDREVGGQAGRSRGEEREEGGSGSRSLADELARLDEEEGAAGGGERWEGRAVSSNRLAEKGMEAAGGDSRSGRQSVSQQRALHLSGPHNRHWTQHDDASSTPVAGQPAGVGGGASAVAGVGGAGGFEGLSTELHSGAATRSRDFSNRFSWQRFHAHSSQTAGSGGAAGLSIGRTSFGGGPLSPRSAAQLMSEGGIDCRLFTPQQLERATGGYEESNLLGRGSFGMVFRGEMLGCKVAVKRLEGQGWQGPEEFHMEVEVLSRMRHPNIVLLMGCCVEEMALVYEFLPGGTLQDKLGPPKSPDAAPLPWVDRLRILSEVASALLYLHQNEPPIVHRDLKPDNILLDGHLASKIGDVGLARLLQADDSVTMKVRGTAGYIDPEEVETCEISVLSDVYALGLIMLQLLTGQRSVRAVHRLLADLHDLAARDGRGRAGDGAVTGEALLKYLDSSAGDWRLDLAERAASIALQCAERRRERRPDLAEVIHPALAEIAKEALAEEKRRKKRIDSQFICPISKEIMRDPVVAADGFTYEREHIARWMATSGVSPSTGQQLQHTCLTPNNVLKSLIQAHKFQ
ncbi:unnamed protein product, partial [Closterium sp. Yama58-4]